MMQILRNCLVAGWVCGVVAGEEQAWEPLFVGVEHREVTLEKPRKVKIHEVRVDTQASGVRFFVTPSNGDKPGEVDGRVTGAFLEEFGLEVAINGSAFDPVTTPGKPLDILGLSIADGETVSPVDLASGNPVFWVGRDGRAHVATDEEAIVEVAKDPQVVVALQGHYGRNAVLVDDAKVVSEGRDIHPRTAVGVSKDGRWVHGVVVDGRQPGYSEGMSLVELAEWMKEAGIWDAMNLDGGGSTTLVIADEAGKARVLNRPSGRRQRSVGNHLGVRAARLTER
ncbi:uncharacterized protein YigE (DUF2233 family) [Haloferula luteola]|uniref:Uncharacterized protein YigE (DUF2233 family) n=1 Tax=Haloferula luteola TaxID=595692 RepID=A0A840UZP5_9BACT|nr:phosphodiester glycosidase family protein [Haloferula luteola]MBB5351587.1 uncharacterized protein YigE (DUF2233 family) [Haloferula luteola]